MRARPLALHTIDNATAKRLLRQYMPIVRALRSYFWSLDAADLQATGEDAILEAYLTLDTAKGCAEASWVRRIIHWRLSEAAATASAQRNPNGQAVESLDVDPQVMNGADPEHQFLRTTAVTALSRLTIRQQNVVDGFMRGETFEELGDQLGISRVQAFYSSKKAFARLRSILEDGDDTIEVEVPD